MYNTVQVTVLQEHTKRRELRIKCQKKSLINYTSKCKIEAMLKEAVENIAT